MLPWLPGFPPQAFPPRSPPSQPFNLSLHSQQQPSPWDCSTIPKLHLPATASSRGPASLSGVRIYGCGKDCLILIPFRLPQIRCFTLSLKCFSSDSDSYPEVGIRPLLQFPHLPGAGPVLLTFLFISLVPSSYRVLCGSIYSFPGEGNGTPLQYSCLENPMDGGAWKAAVCGVTEGWTRLNNFTFTFHFHALEKAMATHSSVLAWRIPGMAEPDGLPSMGSHRVGHD